jgi:hypothetical protein
LFDAALVAGGPLDVELADHCRSSGFGQAARQDEGKSSALRWIDLDSATSAWKEFLPRASALTVCRQDVFDP